MKTVSLPRSREVEIVSDGRLYRVFVAWPSQPPPREGYPLVYVLDANAAFATVVEAVRMRAHRPDATLVGPAVVVGVAYPGDEPYSRARRTYDLTDPVERGAPVVGGDAQPDAAVGGAPAFLRFLQEEVRAVAGQDHPIDDRRRAIFGHSLAGYFVLSTLVTTPAAFDAYVAMSPSIWWNRDKLLAGADALVRAGVPVRARITVGEYEQVLAPWQTAAPPVGTVAERREERRMVDHARDLAERLALVPGAAIEFELLAGEDHASVVPRSISEGLRFVNAPRRGAMAT